MKNPFTPKRIMVRRRTPVERIMSFLDRKKPSDQLILYTLILTTLISGVVVLLSWNARHLEEIPAAGGELREGIVGSPRFVNPVLATTRADQDMVSLLYSGLLQVDESGNLTNDLAQDITISTDALTYNVILRDDIVFHDGSPITADDVLFTVHLIQNPELKSPLRGNFDGVTVEKLGDHEVNFVLTDPYAPFIENLTIGILPKHEWENLTVDQIPFSQHNTEPIGSGPYKIKNVQRNDSGLIDGYILTAFTDAVRPPIIETVTISFFSSDEAVVSALTTDKIDSTTGISEDLEQILASRPDLTTYETALPRTFGIFFNQNKSVVLRQSEVREALAAVIDRKKIVDEALRGHGVPIDSPVPYGFLNTSTPETATSTNTGSTTPFTTELARKDTAIEILEDGGWTRTEDGFWQKDIDGSATILGVDIATANLPFLSNTSTYLESVWGDLGVKVSVRQYEQSDLTQTVIRTRDYEALLFGTTVTRTLDFYPFWHSSQRNDPGLNIALYANITADRALADARTSTSTEARDAAIGLFLSELHDDKPAIFLFAPTVTTITSKKLHWQPINKLTTLSERFANISSWYLTTESVWPFFNK